GYAGYAGWVDARTPHSMSGAFSVAVVDLVTSLRRTQVNDRTAPTRVPIAITSVHYAMVMMAVCQVVPHLVGCQLARDVGSLASVQEHQAGEFLVGVGQATPIALVACHFKCHESLQRRRLPRVG